MTRIVVSLFSVCTLAACGASDTSPGGDATGGVSGLGTGGVVGASGGAPQVPGSGGAVAPGGGGSTPAPSGGAGGALPGSGGAVTASGGAVASGGATTGSGGATPGCDDNALASAGKVCNPTGNPCNIHSGYAGDEFCILPPPEGKGVQIHFGPSDYSNPAEVAKYLIKPTQEFNAYGLATIPGAGQKYFNYVQIRMRPGSHHLINQLVTGVDSTPDGFLATPGCPGTTVGSFPGTQNLVRNMPPGGQQAPENKGLGSQLSADAKLCVNHHGYNYDDSGDQLREVWINVWFVDASEVTQKTTTITVNAGPLQGIPAHTQRALKATATVTGGDGRIVNLFGHRHAHTERFAVWQNDKLVYDSWDWKESIAFDYNSITTNPPLNPDAKKDGAVSGQLPVKLGDKIAIECDVNNTSDQTLTFKNELYTGEMCILFGATVGAAKIGGGLF
jgi:hypothetical protein